MLSKFARKSLSTSSTKIFRLVRNISYTSRNKFSSINSFYKFYKPFSSYKSSIHPLYKFQQCYFSVEEVPVPNLGDSISEGTIVSIVKNAGEAVAQDEVVVEIETDKVVVEIRSPINGYIKEFYSNENDDINVGDKLFSVSTEPVPGLDPSNTKSSSSSSSDTSSSTSTSSTPSPPSPKQSTPPSTPEKSQSSGGSSPIVTSHRTPMIQFKYGDRQAIDLLIKGSINNNINGTSSSEPIDFIELPENLSKMAWTNLDIEAVNSGGAELFDLYKLIQKTRKSKR